MTRDNILILILLLRVIPLTWFYNQGYEKARFQFKNLKAENWIYIDQSLTGDKLVSLTAKGYKRALELIPTYTGKHKRQRNFEIAYKEHHYLIFRYLITALEAGLYSVLIDYDKTCRLDLYLENKDYSVKPDLILQRGEVKDLICLEAHNGSEYSKEIFDKLLRYFIYSYHNFTKDGINSITIHFYFRSERALRSLFIPNESGTEGTIYKHFNQGTRIRFLHERRQNAVSLALSSVFNSLNTGRVKITVSSLDNSETRQIDFLSYLQSIEQINNIFNQTRNYNV